jgi:hypothetical protein
LRIGGVPQPEAIDPQQELHSWELLEVGVKELSSPVTALGFFPPASDHREATPLLAPPLGLARDRIMSKVVAVDGVRRFRDHIHILGHHPATALCKRAQLFQSFFFTKRLLSLTAAFTTRRPAILRITRSPASWLELFRRLPRRKGETTLSRER